MTEKIRSSNGHDDSGLRALITSAIKRSSKKRAQIADELTAITGIRVTEHMLNDFTSEFKKGVRFPLIFCAALCDILDDDSIALCALRPHLRERLEFVERELRACQQQRELEELRGRLADALSREEFAKRGKVRTKAHDSTDSQTALPLGEPR